MVDLPELKKITKLKAKYIYDVIDASDGFYRGTVVPEDRSLMNITFRLPSEELENLLLVKLKRME